MCNKQMMTSTSSSCFKYITYRVENLLNLLASNFECKLFLSLKNLGEINITFIKTKNPI